MNKFNTAKVRRQKSYVGNTSLLEATRSSAILAVIM